MFAARETFHFETSQSQSLAPKGMRMLAAVILSIPQADRTIPKSPTGHHRAPCGKQYPENAWWDPENALGQYRRRLGGSVEILEGGI